ncbi:MAG: hypothetical protein AAF840_10805 [Bacteroidota bacterium]
MLKPRQLLPCLQHWDVSFDITQEAAFPQVDGAIRQLYAAGAAGLGQLATA